MNRLGIVLLVVSDSTSILRLRAFLHQSFDEYKAVNEQHWLNIEPLFIDNNPSGMFLILDPLQPELLTGYWIPPEVTLIQFDNFVANEIIYMSDDIIITLRDDNGQPTVDPKAIRHHPLWDSLFKLIEIDSIDLTVESGQENQGAFA